MSFLVNYFRGSPKPEKEKPLPPDQVDWPRITEADFEALLAEEAADRGTWTVVKNEKNVKVWKNKVRTGFSLLCVSVVHAGRIRWGVVRELWAGGRGVSAHERLTEPLFGGAGW